MEHTVVLEDEDGEVDVYNLKSQPVAAAPEAVPHDTALGRTLQRREVMRVGGGTPAQAVASSIQRCIFDESYMPTIRAIGAGAVNQACKGIAIARGHVAIRGLDLLCAPGFDNVPGDDGQEISSMVFRLSVR